jgi:hypothetical protein
MVISRARQVLSALLFDSPRSYLLHKLSRPFIYQAWISRLIYPGAHSFSLARWSWNHGIQQTTSWPWAIPY